MIRADYEDLIFATEEAKFKAIIEEIKERQASGQPVLVGTVAIETSERLSKALKRVGIEHQVLNAKQHEREAEIITQAGQLGSVTVATNMAGRGVDILLGGNPEGLAKRECIREGLVVDSDEYNARYDELLPKFAAECKAEGEKVPGERRRWMFRSRHTPLGSTPR